MCLASAVLVAWAVFGQSTSAVPASPAFEVADVHVSARSSNPSVQPFDSSAYAANRMKGGFVCGGFYMLRTATMVDLIRTAFGVDAGHVIGGPTWLEIDRFDVIARAPADATPEALKLMLQALLADRFQLAVHHEMRPLPVYALAVGKRPQLSEAKGSGATGCRSKPQSQNGPKNAPGTVSYTASTCQNVSMTEFADALRTIASTYIGSVPVLDRTGLTGSWNFNIQWTAPDTLASAGPEGISLFDAVDRQLGLRLERQETPTPVIVVDHVNQKPTANLPDIAKSLPVGPGGVRSGIRQAKPFG